MKIAIITYHYSNNKGAVMQTYGLCKFLKEQGYELDLIDVRQSEKAKQPLIVKIMKYIIAGYRMREDMKKYYPPLTRRYYSIEDLKNDPPKADYYIVGSDQVWNPAISKDLMFAYFLDFGDDNVKRISYASSFGIDKWNLKNKKVTERVKECLSRFDCLSVREEQGRELCKEVFGLDPVVVLDPTFLNENYNELIKTRNPEREFLCYKLNRTKDFWENAPKVGEKLGLKPTNLNYNYPKKGWKYCFPPSLNTWITKFANAEFVLTDSFHGFVFSVLFHRQFVVILNDDGRNSRLTNLMKLLKFEDRVYSSVEEVLKDDKWQTPIDYTQKDNIITKLREHSRQYLLDSLKL